MCPISVKELDRPITQEEKRHLMSNAADRFKEINDILATVPSRTPPHGTTAPTCHVLTQSPPPLRRAAAAAEDQVTGCAALLRTARSAGGLTLVHVACCGVCVVIGK
jgi:hypothetical protein